MKPAWVFSLLAIALGACDSASEMPDMLAGETSRVVRVNDGDSLVLDGGQTVRLVSIEAPRLGRRDDPDEVYAEESKRVLENLVLGRQVRLYYPGPTRDRYDRALAHLMTVDQSGPTLWVNLAMVERGAAWVRLYPDTDTEADRLLDAESAARAAGRGLWSEADYQPISVEEIEADMEPRFRLIRARLGASISTLRQPWSPPLTCARELGRSDVALGVRPVASSICELPDGSEIELRTFVSGTALIATHEKHVRNLSTEILNENHDPT